jgi:hypothetical protein
MTGFGPPFTDAEVAQLQSELGSTLDLDDLAVRYRRLGSVDAVILEVLRIRLADARERPTSFTIPGEYSEDRAATFKSLSDRVGALDTEVGGGLARIVPGPWSSPDRSGVAYDSEESALRRRRRRDCGGR